MSLAVYPGLAPLGRLGVLHSLALAVPRLALPQVTWADFWPRPQPARTSDSRLDDLKRLLERTGVPPFTVDNGAILRAVPKKRPSHKRTREKLYLPGDKQIQPLQNLRRCPACGKVKRSHFMCMHCFAEIRLFLKQKKRALFGEPEPYTQNLDKTDEKILYPGKYVSAEERKLRDKEWIPKREEPLMYEPGHINKK